MTSTTWYRQPYAPLGWSNTKQSQLLASLTAGQTVMTIWYSWGLSGVTSTNVDAIGHGTNWCAAGIVTTIGNKTEAVPDPVTQSGDQAPPSQRWLWWEARVPQITAWDAAREIAVWRANEPQHPIHGEGMVLAPIMPAGETLNVWFSWKSAQPWDDTGQMRVWLSWVMGVRVP